VIGSRLPKTEKLFEQPSSKTLSVGAPTFPGVRRLDAAFAVSKNLRAMNGICRVHRSRKAASFAFAHQSKPSGFTLNVGAPTFLAKSFVVADLQVGSFLDTARASLKAGHYKTFLAVTR